MGNHNGGTLLVELGQRVIKPFQGGVGDNGLGVALSLSGVQGDDLPLLVLEMIVEPVREYFLVRRAIRLRHVVMVSDDAVGGNARRFEQIADRAEFLARAVFGEIAHDKTKLRFRVRRLHQRKGPFEERHGLLVHVMNVVDGDEGELPAETGVGRAQRSRPEPEREQGAGAATQHVAAGKLARKVSHKGAVD